MFTAEDIMTTRVVVVNADDPVDRAVSLMLRHRISGLPVLDDDGKPVGIVSEFDLLNLVCDGGTDKTSVRKYMSPDLIHVSEKDDWVHIADLFRTKRVRRLPVLRDGFLVGIVSRHDLMRAIRDARKHIRRALAHGAGRSPSSPPGKPAHVALSEAGTQGPQHEGLCP